MSYNSNYKNNNGVIYPFAVITAVLLLLTNLFYLRSIVYSLNYLGELNEAAFLTFVINMLSLAELALILALTISVFARASNHAIGNVQIATAIVTGIELTFRFIAFRGYMPTASWFNYAFLIAYQISMAVVIKLRKDSIKYTWFIPGIMACLPIVYTLFFNFDSYKYIFENFKYISNIYSMGNFITSFLEPFITVAFAFCVMAWASHRVQDKKGASNAQQAQSDASANPSTPYPAVIASAGSARTCPKCGNSLQPRDQFCSICGTNVKVGFCQNCGEPVGSEDVFCQKCGARVQL